MRQNALARSGPVEETGLRRRLTGVAYRLLGSLSEAEDAVQEGYARWYALPAERRAAVISPAAWLTTVVSHVCLDMLGSARARRERYVGPWLPEPLSAEAAAWTSLASGAEGTNPLDRVSLDESVSMAVLTMLERLTPAERVAFVLHDVFGYPFAEIAEITGRNPGACRQLASSARRRVHADGRTQVSPVELSQAVAAFKTAWESGNIAGLIVQLDSDATATIDGGGKVSAALAPLKGSEQIASYFLDIYRRQPGLVIREVVINGAPGLAAQDAGRHMLAAVSFAIRGQRISDIWVMRNPDKLMTWNPPAWPRRP
jgi:RNA polymerase sigma-70 factor (ECF subfamily)